MSPLAHDPRCISLTDSELNDICDCETLRIIDSFPDQPLRKKGDASEVG